MADVVNTAYAVIFVGILLLVGVIILGTVADPMGDQKHTQETLIAAGCRVYTCNGGSPCNSTLNESLCTGVADNLPIENSTRAAPVLINCTGSVCTTLTSGTDYNYTTDIGLFHVLDDKNNGTIKVTYYEDTATAPADNAQQSITGVAYSGFDLAIVMVIVMAAVAIISTVFLIGKRGA